MRVVRERDPDQSTSDPSPAGHKTVAPDDVSRRLETRGEAVAVDRGSLRYVYVDLGRGPETIVVDTVTGEIVARRLTTIDLLRRAVAAVRGRGDQERSGSVVDLVTVGGGSGAE